MVQNFWRVRLGSATKGSDKFEKVFNLCKNEKPPCIAVGWGEIDLSKEIDKIEQKLDRNSDVAQIRRWVKMKKGDHVIAMIKYGTICAIGEIIRERYHKEDDNFKIEIRLPNGPADVQFFNRIDVKWIMSPDKIKIDSLHLPENIKNKLNQQFTIININNDDYTVIKNSIKIPTVKPLYSNDINNILKDLFEQAYNKIDKNTKTVRETILMMRQIADNKGEKLPDNWEEITRDKIKNEWAKNKPD